MSAIQKNITLKPFSKGFHLITREVIEAMPEIQSVEAGILHVFIQHTSASLTINEYADPDVRHDFEAHFDNTVPEHASYYLHMAEGPDDMPAHLKGSILGSSVSIPISKGRLALGTWQGIYLGEHRFSGGSRSLVITLIS
ncbi:MAG: secondary thiamine-phosphate synthase enzyme YjbQ [Bacteroidota bacterium]